MERVRTEEWGKQEKKTVAAKEMDLFQSREGGQQYQKYWYWFWSQKKGLGIWKQKKSFIYSTNIHWARYIC